MPDNYPTPAPSPEEAPKPSTSLSSSPSEPLKDVVTASNAEESDYEKTQHLSRGSARSQVSASTKRQLQSSKESLTNPTNSRSLSSKPLLGPKAAEETDDLVKDNGSVTPLPQKSAICRTTVSPYFPTSAAKSIKETTSPFFPKLLKPKRKASDKVSCIPFPPLRSPCFGLVQERLAHDPFRLLIAVIFLNKTRGSVAMPVFYELMERYPTPADLAAADLDDVTDIIEHLGLQNQRAMKCINLAKAWLERPPQKGKRYRLLHYPNKDDGKDVRVDEVIDDDDDRVAWEIGQLPGVGAYAIDSWRIFCRDKLRGLPTEWPTELTSQAKEEELQKEWTKVLPLDKELRAYLRWRWLRNKWEWNPVTGERKPADEKALAKVGMGGVICESEDGDTIIAVEGSREFKAMEAEPEAEEV